MGTLPTPAPGQGANLKDILAATPRHNPTPEEHERAYAELAAEAYAAEAAEVTTRLRREVAALRSEKEVRLVEDALASARHEGMILSESASLLAEALDTAYPEWAVFGDALQALYEADPEPGTLAEARAVVRAALA